MQQVPTVSSLLSSRPRGGMPPCLPAWVQLAGVGADGGATATVASPSLLQPTAAVVVVCWSLHLPLLPPSGGCTYETGGARVVE